MDWDFIWKAIIIVIAGTFLLRIAGRKTISQMTLAETVIMIAIGSLIIQPVSGRNLGVTIIIGAVLVACLLLLEIIQVKSNTMEKLITGTSLTLIENGKLIEKNLVKARMSVDQLEMNMRQKSISKIEDIQYATIEPNGQFGFILKPEAQPITKKEFQQLLEKFSAYEAQALQNQQQQSTTNHNIFTEVAQKSHETPPPNHLK